jgi:cytoskeletal protein CcmA (bactofilin family)
MADVTRSPGIFGDRPRLTWIEAASIMAAVNEVRIEKIDENEIDTILAEDIDFIGVLSFAQPLMIKGRFRGEIRASGELYVGPGAVVEAEIEASVVSTRGRIQGNVVASNRVELASTATVEGDITTPRLEIEGGCRFNGRCRMEESE